MTGSPRILFTRFPAFDSPKTQAWVGHVERVTGRPAVYVSAPDADGTSTVVWSLVGGNNRELARCVKVFARFGDAVDDAKLTISQADRLEVRPVSDDRRGAYGWYHVFGLATVLACARWYESDRDRRKAIDVVGSLLGEAEIGSGARFTVGQAGS